MIERSVPQNIQQQVIRTYCEKNGLKFLLSATEFEGETTILESIKEDSIVMYSIFCMPKTKEARQRLYESGKDIHFAAENMRMNIELVEITFGVYNARNDISTIASYLIQAGLFCKNESRKTVLYADR